MREIDVVVKSDLFDELGLLVEQMTCVINKENDLKLCGSLTAGEKCLDDYLVNLKVNLCDEKGDVWFVAREYCGIDFEILKYDSFSVDYANIPRFMNLDKLHHVELFPNLVRKKERGSVIDF